MGIPRLMTHLRPYAQCTTLPAAHGTADERQSNDQHATETAIVDGPALAYFAFNRALALRGAARDAFEAAPSYAEVGRIAVAWLNMLQQHGFKIEAVFFDGALPIEKRSVRLARLETCLRQLNNFRSLHGGNIMVPSSRRPLADTAIRDFTVVLPISARSKALPPPPFMVPAVIEALQLSDFAAVTSVKGAEADLYCAHAATGKKAWVFTGDSDLLIYNIHPDSSIVFLQDVQLLARHQGNTALSVTHYVPSQISDRLGLPNLFSFAYAVYLHPHRGFSDCVKTAKLRQDEDGAYERFKANYISSSDTGNNLSLAGNHAQNLDSVLLGKVDPRLSELIYQLMQGSSGHSVVAEYEVYLPFLLEDPSRISGWQSGRDIRRIAYMLLDVVLSPKDSQSATRIFEHERKGPRIARTLVPLMTSVELVGNIDSLLTALRLFMPEEIRALDPLLWRTAASYVVLHPLVLIGKPILSQAELQNLICGLDPCTNWSYSHTAAQLQAVLYSIRLVQQALDVVENLLLSRVELPLDISAAIKHLQQSQIKHLPRLENVFPQIPASRTEVYDRKQASRPLLEKLTDLLTPEETQFEEPSVKKIRNAKRSDSSRTQREPVTPSRFASTNAFNLLLDNS